MEYELYHHGIKGQKWGVRRYQNVNGTLTSAGRKRYSSKLTGYDPMDHGIAPNPKRPPKNAMIDGYQERKHPGAVMNASKPSKQLDRAKKKASRSDGEDEQITTKKKTSRKERGKMSEEELASRIKRLEKETKLKDLEKKNMGDGEEYAKDILRSVGKKVAVQGGTAIAMIALYKAISGNWPENPGGWVPKAKDKW